jgi:2-oxo-3-hexenedioate decarboxylase
VDPRLLADELSRAVASRQTVTPPSSRDGGFDLDTAYAVERELQRMRQAAGHRVIGRKVGFANKAVWRVMKLDTLVWASMYDDTVQYAQNGSAMLALSTLIAPKIEPEIVFKLKTPIAGDSTDAAAVLGAVEWIALGFEIIDAPYPDWKFQPIDFVAAYGLHAALIVGEPRTVGTDDIATLADALPKFKVKLSRDGVLVEEGSGRNSLRSPALCLGELAAAIAKRSDQEPLAAGELVSSGTLTEGQLIHAGETWRAEVDGLDLNPLMLTLQA